MFMCEIWVFDWYFPQFCKSDMSKYGYLEVFQKVPTTSRKRESTVYPTDGWLDVGKTLPRPLTCGMVYEYCILEIHATGVSRTSVLCPNCPLLTK